MSSVPLQMTLAIKVDTDQTPQNASDLDLHFSALRTGISNKHVRIRPSEPVWMTSIISTVDSRYLEFQGTL